MAGSLGREIGDAWAEARALRESDLMPDDYQIERTVRVSDGSGGETSQDSIVGMGRCKLHPSARLGDESLSGSVVIGTSSYTANLPVTTTLRETDTLIINGRRFEVVSPPLRGGNWGTATTAALEERF